MRLLPKRLQLSGEEEQAKDDRSRIARAGSFVDDRLGMARFARTGLRKTFPDHWSFLLGEIALYSFVVLLMTGVYLTFFFDPSQAEPVVDERAGAGDPGPLIGALLAPEPPHRPRSQKPGPMGCSKSPLATR